MSNILELTIYKIKIGENYINLDVDELIGLALWSAYVTSSLCDDGENPRYLKLEKFTFESKGGFITVTGNETAPINVPIHHAVWVQEYDFTQFGLSVPEYDAIEPDLECSLKLLTLPVKTPYGFINKENVVVFFCNTSDPSQLIYSDVVLTHGLYYVEAAGRYVEMSVPCHVEYDKDYLVKGVHQVIVTNPIF